MQLIQNNFLKAVGGFAASNGVQIKAQVWQNITKELNSLGPPRTPKQWKEVILCELILWIQLIFNFQTFGTIKASAKAKLADVHNNPDGSTSKPLSRLEEKVISIYGLDCMDGHQSLGEAGFRYAKV